MSLRFGVNGLGRIGRALIRVAATRPELGSGARGGQRLGRSATARAAPAPRHRARGLSGRGGVAAELPASRRAVGAAHPGADAAGDRLAGARRRGGARGDGEVPAPRPRRRASADPGGSVRQVVVSATVPDPDLTVCLGINDRDLDPSWQRVISNASCTTNCLAPLLARARPRLRRRARADEHRALRHQQPEPASTTRTPIRAARARRSPTSSRPPRTRSRRSSW